MGTTNTEAGSCPECETAIPSYNVIITYDTDEGEQQYAECPDCEDVVKPA